MLRRLGLEFARGRDKRQERQVDVDHMAARQIVAELADRLEERQALDVADSAADLDQNEVAALVALQDEFLDGVGGMRDHLHPRAKEAAAPFLRDHIPLDSSA